MSIEHGTYTVAIPPGETIKEMLAEKNVTEERFCEEMSYVLPKERSLALLEGEEPITLEVAIRLRMCVGGSVRFWMMLESIYQKKLARIAKERTQRE